MTVGAGAMLVLMGLLVLLGQWLEANGALEWERPFMLELGEKGPFSFSTAVFFQTLGTDTTLVILVVATAGAAAWLGRAVTALSIVLAPVVADLVGRFGWLLWDRSRPDLLYDGIASPAFHSFPSGHTSKTVALYGLLVLLWLRSSDSRLEKVLGMVALALIIAVVPLGRMSMGVHWPSDIAAGLIVGAAWLVVLARGLRFETQPAPKGA